ncbi:MAG: riboflavin kinase, partial [Syntrophothermus sp.]
DDNDSYNGMANIGIRPTLDQHVLTIEVNLFDFNGNIYGKEIEVFFIERIRDERKFAGLPELKQQISLDKIRAEEILFQRNNPDANAF